MTESEQPSADEMPDSTEAHGGAAGSEVGAGTGDAAESGATETAPGGGQGPAIDAPVDQRGAVATEDPPATAAGQTDAPPAAGVDARSAVAGGPPDEGGKPVEFQDIRGEPTGGPADGGGTLELLYDLSLPLTVELGRATLKVQDVLALGQGSVVRLDRIAGDPVDVYVGSKKLAQAEVVVLEDQFGIRITHIYPDSRVSDAR